MALFDDLKIFTGNAHPALAADVCAYLGISQGRLEAFKFRNDNTFVRIQENIRERDVFLIQPIAVPVNENLFELLIMIDAAKRASAGRINGGDPVLCLWPQRQEGPAKSADNCQARGESHRGLRSRPGVDRGPARRPDTGLFQHTSG